ncbi:MAG: polysaccharide biosynthesis C-terminal domain-containing protein [bacterium]|nr:polysaccharide biosynthesis C-terminal domain-containing protein [bacterium]MDN5835477.1 polysaccharide biosynthesis C-terminal domain-containing protein [bacterium]
MGRVASVVSRANRKVTIQLAAGLLAGSTLIASGLGLFRDRLLNGLYYENYKVGIDAYTAAFTVPDFMFFVLVSGALSVTFIPVFNQRLGSGNKKSAWQLSTSLINLMALATLVASILIIIFARPLIEYVIAPGLSESGLALATSMMRVIAVNPFLFAIATVIASIQQAVGRFTFYAMAPILYNIGIIIGAVFFTHGINIFGWQVFEGGIMGVALGVALGSVLQLLVSSIGLIGLGFDYQFKIFWKNKGFRKVLTLLPARSMDQGMDYINNIVEINLASRMTAGTVRAFQQASTLHMVPINLIGVAISTAAFPKMTERLGQGRPDLFRNELQSILRIIIWLALPVATIAYFTRGYLVNFIYNGGDPLMAGILGILVVAILFRSVYHIAARSFYAQQDTRTPLYISFVAIGLNIFLAIWLTMQVGLGAYGLAWAQSIVAVVEVTILFLVMSRRIKGLFGGDFIGSVGKMMSAAGFTALVAYIGVFLLPLQGGEQSFFTTFPKFCLIVAVSLATYLWFSKILQLKEAGPVIRRMNKILFGRIR